VIRNAAMLGWRRLLVMAMMLLTLAAASARAEDFGQFYQAYAIVTGTDMRQRPWGMAQCLREVLVKVSGDPRLKDDPRVLELASHAGRFVASFDYVDMMAGIPKKDDQGSYDRPHKLTVHFDPAKIDAILSSLGEKPWHGERPIVIPVLLVHGSKPPDYILSAETPRGVEQRGSFATAADEFGMSVRIPSEAELAGWGISADRLPFPNAPAPDTKANEAIVVGTLDWSESLPGWIGSWRTRWNGADHAWGIKGVNYDAAFRHRAGRRAARLRPRRAGLVRTASQT
jgi:hypothetical protein